MRLRDSYVVPEEPVFKAKKDRAKWCGGKPGREHDYRWWCRLHLQYEEWNEAWAHNREVNR